MPQERLDPPPARPVHVPAVLHRGLLALGVVLMTATLVSSGSAAQGLAVAAGTGLLAAGLALLAWHRRAEQRGSRPHPSAQRPAGRAPDVEAWTRPGGPVDPGFGA